MEYGFEQTWGHDTSEWKEVVLHESMKDVISRMHNRVFVGLPICMDLASMQRNSMQRNSMVANSFQVEMKHI